MCEGCVMWDDAKAREEREMCTMGVESRNRSEHERGTALPAGSCLLVVSSRPRQSTYISVPTSNITVLQPTRNA